MKYALLIYGDEQIWATMSREEMEKIYAGHGAYSDALSQAGALRGGEELGPSSTASCLRFTNGQAKAMDGPFAETKEQLAGFYLIDVNTPEEALEWARKMPGMSTGTVEVRPIAANCA